jgi:hypothetical protein
MQRAVESAIGRPSRSTSPSRMLVFVTPPDVRRNLKMSPDELRWIGVAYGPATAAELIAC